LQDLSSQVSKIPAGEIHRDQLHHAASALNRALQVAPKDKIKFTEVPDQGQSMNDDKICEMVRDAIVRSVAEEDRVLALEWLERQAAIVDAVSALGLIDPDYFKVGRA
jgi:hypothetical protein